MATKKAAVITAAFVFLSAIFSSRYQSFLIG